MKSSPLSQLGRRITEPPIAWLMKRSLDHPQLISLAAGFTDNPSLPVEEARASLDEVLSSPQTGQPALQYGPSAGDGRLRRLTAERAQRQDQADGPQYATDRVLITHGSQQLLYLLCEALCDAGDIVLLEDPTYFVFLGIAQSRAIQCRGVRLAEDGIDLAQLEATLETLKRSGELPRVKMLYLVTYYQNPTGITTALEKKAGALALLKHYERAAGHPIYLLEDAAYRELRFAGADVHSALAVKGGKDRVIYTGTYSKPFATGVRVGYGLLPEPLYTVVLRIRGNHDFGTSNLLQQILAQAIDTGRYEKHLGVLQKRYAQKAAVMADAIGKNFPAGVEWRPPQGGLYVWARAPQSVRTGIKSRFFQKAMRQDVLYVPGELCYADDPRRAKPNHEMRLSFGGAKEADIQEGIARLGRVLREMRVK
ncbi:MAG: PLP-dependent aminotransferase family protein [Verrucomicrobiota bacterium]